MYEDIENKIKMQIENVEILKSGWAGEILSLTLKGSDIKYIVKTYGSSKNGFQDLKQEWKGLNILYRASYPVPKPIVSDFTNEKPYIVIGKIEGDNFWNCYQRASNQNKKKLLEGFVELFLRLHELDIYIADKRFTEDSTFDFIKEEINDIKKLIEHNNLDNFTQIIDWLQMGRVNVSPHKLSIIHRDYHPWNVIVDNNNKMYVIDLVWGIGDYRFDLAWMSTLMERSGFDDFSVTAFNKYEELKNEAISDFDYFKVLSTLRWLVNVMLSLKTGSNLNQTRNAEFENFILPLINNGKGLIQKITHINV